MPGHKFVTNNFSIILLQFLEVFFAITLHSLGHPKPKNDRRIGQPRQVSSLNQKEILVAMVTCSDAATVVLTENCDIYVLHEYQCRKIASKLVCCAYT